MKRCPACGRTFTNNTLINCLNDGTPLVEDAPTPPPYLGVSPAAPAETPPAALSPSEVPASVTYANTPLSAIPELQSPEMQAALKAALDKAGMSALFGSDLSAKSTISVTTSTTTSGPETLFASPQPPSPGFAPPPGYAQPPPAFMGASPYYAGAAPRRKRSPLRGGIVFALIVFLAFSGFRYVRHLFTPSVPADIVAAVKSADAAEAKAVSSLDPASLSSAYTGPALARELSEVDALRTAHRTQVEQLTSQEFSKFQQSGDGFKAQVDVTEQWNTSIYSEPGHTIVSEKSASVNPQTVFLRRMQNGWIVEKIEFHHS